MFPNTLFLRPLHYLDDDEASNLANLESFHDQACPKHRGEETNTATRPSDAAASAAPLGVEHGLPYGLGFRV